MQPTLLASALEMGQPLRGFGPWQDFVNANFPWLDLSSQRRSEFDACVGFRSYGARSLATIMSAECRVTRPERAASRSEAGYLKLLWQRAGSMLVEQDGTSTQLQRGMATICDTGRPYRLWLAEGATFVVLTMPYSAVPSWERISQKVCATTLIDSTTTRAALAAALTLFHESDHADEGGAETVFQAIQWMLSTSLHQMASPVKASPEIKLDRVHQHILSHIDDPDLSPDELASALHVSRRTLYQLFKDKEVTPSRFIRDVRLDAVRQALASPRNGSRSIFEIALDHGFTDSASFSRMFKAAFRISPSEWRSQHACNPTELQH
jgi:AraC-like DNA-binding protein